MMPDKNNNRKKKITTKGMTASFLVWMIITIAAFMLIGGTLMKFLAKADDQQAENLCQKSIALRAATALQVNTNDQKDFDFIQSKVKAVPVLCKTIDTKVKGSKEKIEEQIAQKIARCWWMFGEGRYGEILHGSEVRLLPSVLGVANEANKCFTCYTVLIDEQKIVDEKKKESASIQPVELLDYLWTKPVKQKNVPCIENCVSCTTNTQCTAGARCLQGKCEEVQSLNHIQYIQQYGGPGMFVDVAAEGILPKRAYAISILPKTIEKEQTNWAKWVGITAMGTAFAGATVCTVATGGACAPLLMAALGTTASVGGTVMASTLTYKLVQGEYRPQQDAPNLQAGLSTGEQLTIKQMFQERAYTSIYLSNLTTAQQFCANGDLAGE